MFGYRRHSFNKAFRMLSAIRADPTDLPRLLSLQELLISEITLAEGRVRENKKKARIGQEGKREYFNARAKSLQNAIYYWKTFGDAVAFTYIDRFALKHVYYNLHNLKSRQNAGFLSGSVGFEREVEVVRDLLNAGHPCVLADLTNTVRYGDVCVLHGPDPVLIEVKSSRAKGRRVSRQRADLKKLSEFYRTDKLDGLRGLPRVRRFAFRTECKTFAAEFNQCIQAAYDAGYAVAYPEEGICYIAVSEGRTPASEIIQHVKAEKPWVVFLNELKSEQVWAPYYPFTLLIETGRALYDFMLGRLFIVVSLDIAVMKRRIAQMGYVPEFVQDSETPLRARTADGEGEVRLSQHLLLRAALEAVSIDWIVQAWLGAVPTQMTQQRYEWSGTEE